MLALGFGTESRQGLAVHLVHSVIKTHCERIVATDKPINQRQEEEDRMKTEGHFFACTPPA